MSDAVERSESPTSPSLQAFIACIQDMLRNENYLVPYIWAQRKVRSENYRMQSQGLLEDMFFDTLGDFVKRERASMRLVRRTGNEAWDYRFNDQCLSHKEAISPGFTAIWEGGAGATFKTPRYPTWTFQHPVVLSYSPPLTRATIATALPGSGSRTRRTRARGYAVTAEVIERLFRAGRTESSRILLVHHGSAETTLIRAWTVAEWQANSYKTLRDRMTRSDLANYNLWAVPLTAADRRTGFDWCDVSDGQSITVHRTGLPPGLYVIPDQSLKDVLMLCNNRAHFPAKEFVRNKMREAMEQGRYVAYHLWPACFAPTTPPNLYQELKQQFDAMFHARAD